MMGWLDANEYVLLEVAARERLDEVRAVDDGHALVAEEDIEDDVRGRLARVDHARGAGGRGCFRPPTSCEPRHRAGLSAEPA